MSMELFQKELNEICAEQGALKVQAKDLLKEYIREFGPVSTDFGIVETSFYNNGYFTAEVYGVRIDSDDNLCLEFEESEFREDDDWSTADTWLDLANAIIGNHEACQEEECLDN